MVSLGRNETSNMMIYEIPVIKTLSKTVVIYMYTKFPHNKSYYIEVIEINISLLSLGEDDLIIYSEFHIFQHVR